jgi:hypothetical protein
LTDFNVGNFLGAGNAKKCEKVILKVRKRWRLRAVLTGLSPSPQDKLEMALTILQNNKSFSCIVLKHHYPHDNHGTTLCHY